MKNEKSKLPEKQDINQLAHHVALSHTIGTFNINATAKKTPYRLKSNNSDLITMYNKDNNKTIGKYKVMRNPSKDKDKSMLLFEKIAKISKEDTLAAEKKLLGHAGNTAAIGGGLGAAIGALVEPVFKLNKGVGMAALGVGAGVGTLAGFIKGTRDKKSNEIRKKYFGTSDTNKIKKMLKA